jgi:hypothetical protein
VNTLRIDIRHEDSASRKSTIERSNEANAIKHAESIRPYESIRRKSIGKEEPKIHENVELVSQANRAPRHRVQETVLMGRTLVNHKESLQWYSLARKYPMKL